MTMKLNNSKHSQIMNDIINLVNRLEVKMVEGFDEIDFTEVDYASLQHLHTGELNFLYKLINEDNEYKQSIIQQIKQYAARYGMLHFPKLNEMMKESSLSNLYTNEDLLKLLEEIKSKNKDELQNNLGIENNDKDDIKLDEDEQQANLVEENITKIYEQIDRMGISYLFEFDIDFSTITRDELSNIYSLDDLEFILTTLLELNANGYEVRPEVVNPLEIIYRFKDGAITKDSYELDNNEKEFWRQEIPTFIKQRIPAWKEDPIEVFYDNVKSLMSNSTGKTLVKVRNFASDLSQIVFNQEDESEESTFEMLLDSEFSESDKDIAESIFTTVEMIILPHIEVLERIEQSGGNIQFVNIWNEHFSESLKKEVKDRDGWKCVACEGETDLHVHHKIPREKGGVNHKNNLVTLCASCHKVIETADVNKAFKKCLANYKRNKLRGGTNRYVSQDKSLLKDEVERKLDELVNTLNNKDEHLLVNEVLDIMDQLEVIFYE